MTSLKQTIKTIDFARHYQQNICPITHLLYNGKATEFYANNRQIAPFLEQNLTLTSFQKLFELCLSKGVFDLKFNHHIPFVTLHAAAKHMTRKWPRDHMGMIPLIAARYPDELWSGLLQWCQTYSLPSEVRAFARVYKNPAVARQNYGIAHVFWQTSDGSMQRDKGWKMNQRIESHGEFLRYLTFYTRQRLSRHLSVPQVVIQTIIRLTHYLYVQGISPQSCGPWEEIPFAKGCNWDNLSVVQAFRQILALSKELAFYPAWQKKFLTFEQNLSRQFKLRPLFKQPSLLSDFINRSLKDIRRFYLDEFHGQTARIDASLAMLAAEDIDLSATGNLITNINKHLRLLTKFEKHLVHEFGSWRYNSFNTLVDGKPVKSCDSYLNLNYYLLCDKNGFLYPRKRSLDSKLDSESKPNDNGVAHFQQRALSAHLKTSAQWGLPLSYAAIAYGKLVALLLDRRDKNGHLSATEQNLLNLCFNKQQEFIKRTYATISGCLPDGTHFLKADGNPIAPWRKPEAYQAITSCIGSRDFAFIPGVNDHLGWDAAKCFEASQLFIANLQRLT